MSKPFADAERIKHRQDGVALVVRKKGKELQSTVSVL
jgi:hypothetical protein